MSPDFLGVTRRQCSDLYPNCFSVTTHASLYISNSSVSPHKTVKTSAGRSGDIQFAEGDISFIVELCQEEMNPVCFCCLSQEKINNPV